jgi:uncharacterized phage infection (PIP) family protein YhgE
MAIQGARLGAAALGKLAEVAKEVIPVAAELAGTLGPATQAAGQMAQRAGLPGVGGALQQLGQGASKIQEMLSQAPNMGMNALAQGSEKLVGDMAQKGLAAFQSAAGSGKPAQRPEAEQP